MCVSHAPQVLAFFFHEALLQVQYRSCPFRKSSTVKSRTLGPDDDAALHNHNLMRYVLSVELFRQLAHAMHDAKARRAVHAG